MSSITSKITVPMILVGIFAITVFISLNYENLNPSFYIVLSLLIIFVFFFGFSTGQSIAAPVRKLLERANDLTRGNLKARAYLESKDEINDLAKIFNKLADELEKSRSETLSAERSVDIKVRAQTQALQETITALEQKIKNRTLELKKIADDSRSVQEMAKRKEVEVADLKRQISSLRTSINSRPKQKRDEQIENES